MNKSKICVVNIIANDYLPNQLVFAKQFKKLHPKIDLFCLSLENKDFKSPLFTTLKLKNIKNIKNINLLTFKYNVLELSTAVKPHIINWLLQKYQYDKVVYFDSDILVKKSIIKIINRLNKHDVILTPHIKQPIKDNKLPNEIDFAKSGYFNLGFIAFKQNKKTLDFLNWWSEKTEKYCYIDFDKFYFVDQRWIDFAPIFLDAYIIKEAGYNIAYFNLQEYINKVNKKDIYFIHFSGFDIKKISKYQTRFDKKSTKEYYSFFKDYGKRIKKESLKIKKTKYIYNYFDNNVYIAASIKNILKTKQNLVRANFKNPFKTSSRSFYSFLTQQHPSAPCINLIYLIYFTSKKLQQKFPNLDFSGFNQPLYKFIEWFIKNGQKKLNLDNYFIKKQKKLINDIKPFLTICKSQCKLNQLAVFVKILKLKNKTSFIINIYLLLLNRMPDKIAYKQTGKKEILDNIFNSQEYYQKRPKLSIKKVRQFIGKLILFFQ